ncbi:MAG TPA: adenylate/guanylate cyclase domain-containing protein [Bacteroidota bacterium]|nr:adenylate/guanylate cyclase domain-containing protein [Bacteroidota bacterium]
MYHTLIRKTIRAVVIGTALAVLPAVPFYIYTFDATPRQLAILVPLFIPALIAMFLSDLWLIRAYLKPVKEFYKKEDSSVHSSDAAVNLARERALNFPVFGVLRVFLPHAIIGSGVFNLCIMLGNRFFSLGIDPSDYLMYWVINLTVVPVTHAVYEYFGLAKAMIPTIQVLQAKVPSMPEETSSRVVTVRLATKVIVIFMMLGMAPLFILGVSLNKKHTTLLIEKEEKHLLHNAVTLAWLLPTLDESQRKSMLLSYGEDGIAAVEDSSGRIVFSESSMNKTYQDRLRAFLAASASASPYYAGDDLLAAKVASEDGKFVVGVAVPMKDLTAASSSLRYGTVLIIIASILLLGALLVLVARDINESTKKLVAGLKEVEGGAFDHEVKIYSTDEFSTIGNGFNRMIAGLRERNFIKDTFGKYVAPTVMEKILHDAMNAEGGKGFRLGGERRTVTILMSDIRDFTRRTEQSSAEEIVDLLNRYLERMVHVVEMYDGVVDKYIGDALMVLFGAPLAKPDDPDRAVQAAFAMRTELSRLNQELKKSTRARFSPVRIGIGIHTGEVVAGSIGSANRLEYTVIGDAVNLASRIEGLTKLFKTDILISEATAKKLKGDYPLTQLPRAKVKGKKETVVVFKAGKFRGQ